MSDNEIKKVAIYTRVSTEDQARGGFSLEYQLEKLRAFCIARDWDIAGEYIEEGESGKTTKRPQYQKMFAEIDKWDGLLVMKMDRAHRNQVNFTKMMEALSKKYKHFVSITESYDTSTAIGRLLMDFSVRLAQFESEQTGERTYIGMAQKAKNIDAGFMGHRPCFGYKTVKELITDNHGNQKTKSHLEPIPEELEIAKRIFELYNEGFSMPKITKKFKNVKVQVKKSKKYPLGFKYFTCSMVQYILKNPLYTGYYKWHNIVKKADVKPIISSTLWDLVQKRKCQEADRGEYVPLLIKDKDVFEVPKEKIKSMPAICRANHNIS